MADPRPFIVTVEVNIPGTGLRTYTKPYSAYSLLEAIDAAISRVMITPRRVQRTQPSKWTVVLNVAIPSATDTLDTINCLQQNVTASTAAEALQTATSNIIIAAPFVEAQALSII